MILFLQNTWAMWISAGYFGCFLESILSKHRDKRHRFAKGERKVGGSERYRNELVSCRSGILKPLLEASGMTGVVSLLTTGDCGFALAGKFPE